MALFLHRCHTRLFVRLVRYAAVLLVVGSVFASSARAQAAADSPHKISAKDSTSADKAYLEGAKQLRAAKYEAAEEQFARAVSLNPLRSDYVQALALTQEHRITEMIQQAASIRAKDPRRADELLVMARKVDAQNPRLTQRDDAPSALPVIAPPAVHTELASLIVLSPLEGKHSFHQRGDTRGIAQAVAGAYGISLIFDPEIATKQFRFDLENVDYAAAASVLQMMSGTLIVNLDQHTILLANDTPSNRTRLERVTEETFNLPGYTAEQINDIANVARTVFDVKQVSVQPNANNIVLRAPADTLAAIDSVFRDLIDSGAEVSVEIKLYSVQKSNIRNLGIVLPQQINGYSVAAETQNILSQNATLIQQLLASGVLPATATPQQIALYLLFVAGLGNSSLISNSFLIFGHGLSLGALSAGNNPMLNLALTQSEARTLDDLQLRVTDRQTATFRSGTRYPIQTSTFSVGAGAAAAGIKVNGVSLSSLLTSLGGGSGLGGQVVPQIQYEDLGLTVKAVPHVQRGGTMAMHLEVKVEALAGSALNGIPVLASRQISSDLTLQDGETTMMVSYLTKAETSAVSGLPGLSEIPGFQSTTNQDSNRDSSELVLLLTPHIVRRGHLDAMGPYIPLINRPAND